MFSGHHLRTLTRLRAPAWAACVAVALVLAACGPEEPESDEPIVLDVADKARVTIEAEFGTTKVEMAGLQELWITRSSGWDPCPEMLGTEFQPETCWIRAYVDETLVATLLPEPNGTLGPYAIPLHFDVFDFLLRPALPATGSGGPAGTALYGCVAAGACAGGGGDAGARCAGVAGEQGLIQGGPGRRCGRRCAEAPRLTAMPLRARPGGR